MGKALTYNCDICLQKIKRLLGQMLGNLMNIVLYNVIQDVNCLSFHFHKITHYKNDDIYVHSDKPAWLSTSNVRHALI